MANPSKFFSLLLLAATCGCATLEPAQEQRAALVMLASGAAAAGAGGGAVAAATVGQLVDPSSLDAWRLVAGAGLVAVVVGVVLVAQGSDVFVDAAGKPDTSVEVARAEQ